MTLNTLQARCSKCEHVFTLYVPSYLSASETIYYNNCPKCGTDSIEEDKPA